MANVFCGYLALTESFKAGALLGVDAAMVARHFDMAAMAIGFAVLFDGLDGRIARLMGTTSPFGTELDSLADTITFGIAPAFLAMTWGVRAVLPAPDGMLQTHLVSAGWVVSFLFIICSAARLARFNVQSTGGADRPEHKQFVGLPTPAAAGLVAAIVHFGNGALIEEWLWVPVWLVLLLGTSVLMVSTWRYHSFKDLDLRRQRKFPVVIVVGGLFGLIWMYSEVVLLVIATSYLMSGIIVKLKQVLHRGRHDPEPLPQERNA